MKTLISCAYNMDNCCVEVKFIYNAPLEYADLILNGDPETYLKTVTEYKPWDS